MVFFPMMNAAHIKGPNLTWLLAAVARILLMWSIAGMTAAKFGVPAREKYKVVSLNIYSGGSDMKERQENATHL